MKKILLTLLCVVCLTSAATLKAQDNKMWVGGAIGFTSTDFGGDDNLSGWKFAPQWGMMLSDKWGAGVELSLSGWSVGDADANAWKVVPYARYYMDITDNFKFFGDALVGFGGNSDDGTSLIAGVRPGFQYWFSPKFSMATTFGFLGYDQEEVQETVDGVVQTSETSSFGLTLDATAVNFGLYFHF